MIFGKNTESRDSKLLFSKIKEADTIAISGHVNPDGDCVGSCLGLCTYILDQYPDKKVDVYLDAPSPRFLFLKYADQIILREEAEEQEYDLFFSLDCSEPERLGDAKTLFDHARSTVCVDHHVTNLGFGDLAFIEPEASSTCEILFTLFEYEKISFDCAQDLYLGIVHDTGVFKHSNTTRKVMEIAGALIEKGVKTNQIIDDTFYRKTYLQNQILGRALMESILLLDGKIIFSILRKKDIVLYGVTSDDLDGIIDQLRITEGVECALFLYEKEEGIFKVSMRSNSVVDVSKIASSYGGGGHVRAAGCTIQGEPRDIINNISGQIADQLEKAGTV